MKKLIFLSASLLIFFFSGCTTTGFQSTASAPGDVLGTTGSSVDNQKVVTFYVIGKGLEPENALTKGEAVIMAERAAVADGYRQLVEKVRGVYVDAFMKAGRGTVNHDMIQIHTQSWLRGAEIMEVSQGEYGITSARLRLRINFAKQGMVWWPVGMGNNVEPRTSSASAITGGNS
ncbi:LPP20 family lipoprotein [Desulfospira joergensenii]|uniref:LPP20 family lipoprotein n=1 Tax=Desulfospira joergensenii TaxID=53329 RepID=UPI0003B36B30|nr:hypothetical protein [Desulfospira joergensenii]